MNEECKGCIEYRVTNFTPYMTPRLSETEHCPCLTCLVKGICESSCDAYIEYADLCNERRRLNE